VVRASSLTVREIDADAAAAALGRVAALDPRGIGTDDDVLHAARTGRCFELSGDDVRAVYVLQMNDGAVWVQALQGAGPLDLAAIVDEVIAAQAEGCGSVAFQTARPGLMRKALKRGYRVAGWIMKKDLQ
jgi:hypothetical protein